MLDDFHAITSPAIQQEVGYLLDHLPRDVQVAIATHTDRGLRLGRLRAMGDLSELRNAQLRFTDDEAAQLLNRIHGLNLAAAELATLQGRTEWVAGLNLAALSLQREGDRERILERLPADDGFLVDYLWDEVVLSQPRTVRHFLMRTAILDRLTASLCDAVAERDDSDDMLREPERANLFVVPLEGSRRWFRYHRLFRDLPRSQLERYAPEVVPDLHRRASTWYAAHGFTVEAIDHAIAAGDVNYAAAELDRQWLDLYSAGQSATILDWIDRLPDDVLADYPTLALARAGIARAIGRLDEVEPWLQRAEAAAGDAPTVGFGTSVASGAALGRSMYRLALGDVDGAIAAGRQVVELERSRSPLEPTTANYFLGVVLFFDDPAEAEPLLHGFLERSSPGVDDVRRYFAQALLAEALEVARARQLAGR